MSFSEPYFFASHHQEPKYFQNIRDNRTVIFYVKYNKRRFHTLQPAFILEDNIHVEDNFSQKRLNAKSPCCRFWVWSFPSSSVDQMPSTIEFLKNIISNIHTSPSQPYRKRCRLSPYSISLCFRSIQFGRKPRYITNTKTFSFSSAYYKKYLIFQKIKITFKV